MDTDSYLIYFLIGQEKAGKRVFNAAQKGLPVAAGVKALGR